MRGLPKFLLPCDTAYKTLIENHVDHLLTVCEFIWIPTKPDFESLIHSLGLPASRVKTLPMITESMTQTIQNVLKVDNSQFFQLIMPDTYFQGGLPYGVLDCKPDTADLACWAIQDHQKGKLGQVNLIGGVVTDIQDKKLDCNYEHSWGALTFNRSLLQFAKPSDPHIGFSIASAITSGERVTGTRISGKYYDCGTPDEYLSMLKENVLGLK
jgi:hypothetical protein